MSTGLNETRKQAAELLAWHISAGVDAVLDDVPHNRFEEAANDAQGLRDAPKRVALRSEPTGIPSNPRDRGASVTPVTPGPAKDWVEEARARAAAAQSLDELRAHLVSFEGCPLSRTAKSCILANSASDHGILVIGDAPEADDDRSGEAFSGRPGVLLDAMMKAIGLERDQLILTTAIPWRPPGNRAATVHELEVCAPFLLRQVELVRPRLVLALGALPAQLLAGRTESVLKLRGQWINLDHSGQAVTMMVTLPPAYLLRQPMQKRFAWRDLKMFRKALCDFHPL
jgi:uracil-DNA glycosylase family 4